MCFFNKIMPLKIGKSDACFGKIIANIDSIYIMIHVIYKFIGNLNKRLTKISQILRGGGVDLPPLYTTLYSFYIMHLRFIRPYIILDRTSVYVSYVGCTLANIPSNEM